jgi:hypothetical protein
MANHDAMVAAMREVQDEILARPGVSGIEVGYRLVGGRPTNELAICVHVTNKREDVPPEERIPEEIGGFKTDVIEGQLTPDQGLPDTRRYDPTMGGIQIGTAASTVVSAGGTLGCHAHDNTALGLRGLTNQHVLTSLGSTTGTPVIQPDRPPGTAPADTIGAVEKIPPQQVWVKGTRSGYVDCGTLTLSARAATAEVTGIGPVRGTRVIETVPDFPPIRVRKRGATTGLTHGVVRSVTSLFTLNPQDPTSPMVVNAIGIQFDAANPANESPRWSDRGDSGSVVVDDAGNVIGLHFGSTTPQFGYACAIDLVEDILDVTVAVRPPPRVTGLFPASGSSQGGAPVFVQGSGFQLVTPAPIMVEFDGQAATFAGVLTDTEIAVIAPPHAAGEAAVQVTNAAGTSESVPESTFTYIEAPVVQQVAPATGSPFGGQSTTISGRGFDGVTAVLFGIAPALIAFAGFTEITIISPPGVPGLEVDVTVTTLGGTSLTSDASKYRYQ